MWRRRRSANGNTLNACLYIGIVRPQSEHLSPRLARHNERWITQQRDGDGRYISVRSGEVGIGIISVKSGSAVLVLEAFQQLFRVTGA